MTSRPSPESQARLLLLEHPAFGLYWCARVGSALSFQMQAVAVGWQIYSLTHSTFQLGMVGLAQFLPIVLFTLPAGHTVDRYDRRVIYGITLGLQGLATAILAAGTWGHWLGVPGIFAIAALMGAARSFQGPANQALMPTLVPAPLLPKAIAWATAAFQTASIVGTLGRRPFVRLRPGGAVCHGLRPGADRGGLCLGHAPGAERPAAAPGHARFPVLPASISSGRIR